MQLLAPTQIAELTARARPSAQVRVLNALGIAHACRPDGSLIVLESAVVARLGGEVSKERAPDGPKWESMQ